MILGWRWCGLFQYHCGAAAFETSDLSRQRLPSEMPLRDQGEDPNRRRRELDVSFHFLAHGLITTHIARGARAHAALS